MQLVSSCPRQGVAGRNFAWLSVLYVIILLSKFTILHVAAMFWRGNIFRIWSVRLYVKFPRGACYLESFGSLPSHGEFPQNICKVQNQGFVHQVYFTDTPALGAKLSRRLSVPVQEKTCKEKHPQGKELWLLSVYLCSCVCLCVLWLLRSFTPMDSLQTFWEKRRLSLIWGRAHAAHSEPA